MLTLPHLHSLFLHQITLLNWKMSPKTLILPQILIYFNCFGKWNLGFDYDWNRNQAVTIKEQQQNDYAAKMLTKAELKDFFGLHVTMEMFAHKDRYAYFQMKQNHSITYTPGFGTVIAWDRFQAVWTMLHIVNESDPDLDKTDKIYTNRLLLEYLLKKFRYHVPWQHFSLDEWGFWPRMIFPFDSLSKT